MSHYFFAEGQVYREDGSEVELEVGTYIVPGYGESQNAVAASTCYESGVFTLEETGHDGNGYPSGFQLCRYEAPDFVRQPLGGFEKYDEEYFSDSYMLRCSRNGRLISCFYRDPTDQDAANPRPRRMRISTDGGETFTTTVSTVQSYVAPLEPHDGTLVEQDGKVSYLLGVTGTTVESGVEGKIQIIARDRLDGSGGVVISPTEVHWANGSEVVGVIYYPLNGGAIYVKGFFAPTNPTDAIYAKYVHPEYLWECKHRFVGGDIWAIDLINILTGEIKTLPENSPLREYNKNLTHVSGAYPLAYGVAIETYTENYETSAGLVSETGWHDLEDLPLAVNLGPPVTGGDGNVQVLNRDGSLARMNMKAGLLTASLNQYALMFSDPPLGKFWTLEHRCYEVIE